MVDGLLDGCCCGMRVCGKIAVLVGVVVDEEEKEEERDVDGEGA
jgi:hypothetical protein